MEDLEDLLEYARAAERDSKEPDRNGVAVHLYKRSGVPIKVRARWTENPNPEQRITRYAHLLLAGAIPTKLPYDLRQLAKAYEGWPQETVGYAIRQDVLRVIRDKQPRSGRSHMAEIEKVLTTQIENAESLHRFAKELLIARQMATALGQAGGEPDIGDGG